MSSKISFAVLEGAQSLGRAQLGDISILIDRLRSESPLLPEERQFLADLVEGKRKLPPNRPSKLATELRDERLVETFLIECAAAIEPKVAERVAFEFGVTPSHLHRIHRQLKGDPARYERLSKRAARKIESYFQTLSAYQRERRESVQHRWDARRMRRILRAEQEGD